AATAFRCDDRAVTALLTRAVKITQIGAHKSACRRNFARLREKIDMKMRNASRRRGHLAPPMHECPPNEPARTFVIAKIPGQRAEKEPDILVQRAQPTCTRTTT